MLILSHRILFFRKKLTRCGWKKNTVQMIKARTKLCIKIYKTNKRSEVDSVRSTFYAQTLIFDSRPFMRLRHSLRIKIYLRILSRSPEIYSLSSSK